MWTTLVESKKDVVRQVMDRCRELAHVSAQELLRASVDLRARVCMGDRNRSATLEAFALVREASRRTLGMAHHDVQILGGWHLAHGRVIEMETGQGKTLTATLPLVYHALLGRGAHLATSNDYLAQRDSETMSPLFQALGLRCGYIADQMPDDVRTESYRCDITYGTGTEFGFDFLKDRMKRRGGQPADHGNSMGNSNKSCVQRGLHFMLADEADSLLIDDANTPLILGTNGRVREDQIKLFSWIATTAPLAEEGTHFTIRLPSRSIELTSAGRHWTRAQLKRSGWSGACSMLEVFDLMEKGVWIHREFHRDRQYIVRDGEVVLISEGTGRLGEGRQLQDGLHQLIQAKENIPITPPNSHAARITVQGFFLSYKHLAGMSGTVMSAKQEFGKVYGRAIVAIPTAQRSLRTQWPTRYFRSDAERWDAICEEVQSLREQGRSVLIGTRSVAKSERLSNLLTKRGFSHCVLNAKLHAEEAEIIARAGQAGAVTVATGLAGRGTDIKLTEEVRHAGGLHVILSELHDSKRSDQQLFGRCARQGDPGSYRQFLSLEDEILDHANGHEQARQLRAKASAASIPRLMHNAQSRLEARSRQSRTEQLQHEKRKLRSLREMGLDPVLDTIA